MNLNNLFFIEFGKYLFDFILNFEENKTYL